MKILSFLLFFLCLTPSVLSGQKAVCTSCDCILERARKTTDFEDAIKQYNSARNNCPATRATAIDAEIIGVFQKINQLRIDADKLRIKAEDSQKKLEEKKREENNDVIRQFYSFQESRRTRKGR